MEKENNMQNIKNNTQGVQPIEPKKRSKKWYIIFDVVILSICLICLIYFILGFYFLVIIGTTPCIRCSYAPTTQKIADLRQIQTALEIYYDEHGRYPATEGVWEDLIPKYLPGQPMDPEGLPYAYASCGNNNEHYTLGATFENKHAALESDIDEAQCNLAGQRPSDCSDEKFHYCVVREKAAKEESINQLEAEKDTQNISRLDIGSLNVGDEINGMTISYIRKLFPEKDIPLSADNGVIGFSGRAQVTGKYDDGMFGLAFNLPADSNREVIPLVPENAKIISFYLNDYEGVKEKLGKSSGEATIVIDNYVVMMCGCHAARDSADLIEIIENN